MSDDIEAKLEAILMTPKVESFVTTRIPEVTLTLDGIPGDRHYGATKLSNGRELKYYPRGTVIKNRRQISVLSFEELEDIARRMGVDHIQPEWLGANFVFRGCPDLSHLPVGTRILFPSGASLYNETQNFPCKFPGEVIQAEYPDKPKMIAGFMKHARQLRGIVCSVERPGLVEEGCTARIIFPPKD